MPGRYILIALLVPTLWALNSLSIKVGIQEIPPLMMTAMRFTVVALLIVPFTRITKPQLMLTLRLSFTFGLLHFTLFFFSFNKVDSGTATLMTQLGTPIAAVLAVFVLKEKMNVVQISGLALSILGVTIISGSPSIPDVLTLAILVTSAVGWAWSNIIVKTGTPIHPATMAGWLSLFAIPQAGLASLLFESDHITHLVNAGWRGWMGVLYSAIMSSIIAYTLWYRLLMKLPVSRLVPYALLCPVVAIVAGCIILGESYNQGKIVGALFVISGVGLSTITRKSLKASAPNT